MENLTFEDWVSIVFRVVASLSVFAGLIAYVVRIHFKQTYINDKLDSLDKKMDDKFDSLDKKIDDKFDSLDKKIDNVEKRLDDKIDNIAKGLDDKIDNIAKGLDDKIDNLSDSLNARMNRVEDKLDKLFFHLIGMDDHQLKDHREEQRDKNDD